MSWQNLRERVELLTRLERGEISKEAAVALAAERGYSLVPPPPDPKDFDPQTFDDWSLSMAFAWAAFRDDSAVRWSWRRWTGEVYDWEPVFPFLKDGAQRLVQRRHHTLVKAMSHASPYQDEFVGAPWDETPFARLSLVRTLQQLWDALASGRISARGVDLRQGVNSGMSDIARHDWHLLKPSETAAGDDALHFGDGNLVYVGIIVNRIRLVATFPPKAETSAAVVREAPVGSPQPATDVAAPGTKGRGRPAGSTNWFNEPFLVEYERRLRKLGKPGRPNVKSWQSKGAAAETVLEWFAATLRETEEPPTINTAKAWAEDATGRWVDAGSPREESPIKPGNSGN